jgi:hypothetical protein
MPYEYTEEGMLQRMNAYIEHQNFCQFQKQPAKWPPNSAITFILGEKGQSCKDVCWSKSKYLNYRGGRDFIVVRFTTTCAISVYHY